MMTCRQCVELLLEFIDGEQDAALSEHIREHLACCLPCVTYVETYRITIHLTHKLTCAQLPPEFAERLWRMLNEGEGQPG
jgi:anti-sigma factor RsiW